MKRFEDHGENSGIPFEESTYVNMINLRAQKTENIPNRKETPAAKNTHNQVILILVVLLILMFLILVVLTGLLFHNCKSISEEVSHMKNNDTEIMKSMLNELENRVNNFEFQQNVENLRKIKPSCQSGWLEFEGHCYLFFTKSQLNWTRAELMCRNKDSHLVIINNEAEQKFLLKNYNEKFYWIGLTDLETEGTFKWIDGTGLSYTFWNSGEPNNHNQSEQCVHLFYEGKWNDFGCNQKSYAICEKNLI